MKQSANDADEVDSALDAESEPDPEPNRVVVLTRSFSAIAE